MAAVSRPAGGRRRLSYPGLVRVGQILVLVATAGAWEWVTRSRAVSPLILTPVTDTVSALVRYLGTTEFRVNVQVTLFEIAIAFVLAAGIGLALGFLFGGIRFVGRVCEPLVIAFFAVPSVILYPLFFLVLGLGPASKIAFAAVYAVFPILLNTVAGFRNLDPALVAAAVSMGASTWQLYTKVIARAILPSVISGLRIGLNLTLTGVVAGEILASEQGLGYLIRQAGTLLETGRVLGLVLVILAFAVISHYGLSWVENRLCGWQRAI